MDDQIAVLWDLDGTLVDSEPLHEKTTIQLLQDNGVTAPETLHQAVVGRSAFETYCYYRDELGLKVEYHDWLIAKYHHYLAEAPGVEAFATSVSAFYRLQNQGMPQAIVSNSDRLIVQANLMAVGLQSPGQITVSRNDVRQGKPSAEPYLRAARLLDIDPASCAVIEDSATGAQAGLAAGMQVFGLMHEGVTRPAFPDNIRDVLPLSELDGQALASRIEYSLRDLRTSVDQNP